MRLSQFTTALKDAEYALNCQTTSDTDLQPDPMLALREELRLLLQEWDVKLAKTPPGQRAHLLETLGSRSGIERTRRERQTPSRLRRT